MWSFLLRAQACSLDQLNRVDFGVAWCVKKFPNPLLDRIVVV